MTRPFYWSVRREIWENRAVYLAPLAAAGVVLFGFLFALRAAPDRLQAAETASLHLRAIGTSPDPATAAQHLALAKVNGLIAFPYAVAGGGLMIVAIVVAVFYSLGALHNERRDRSVLFWKSLPVSDLVTVLAKAAVPLVVLPVVAVTMAIALQILMVGLETARLAASGVAPALLWDRIHLLRIWAIMPYGVACLALWQAPVVGWLMLVSAWAKRMPILWAVAVPAALCAFEPLALGSDHVWTFLRHRLVSGFEVGFSPLPAAERTVFGFQRIDPVALVSNPGLWGGLVVAALFLAACVWLRRRADPI